MVILFYITAWVGAIRIAFEEQKEIESEEKEAGVKAAPPPATPTAAPTRQITSALLDNGAPTAAYISDAMLGFLGPLRGESVGWEWFDEGPLRPFKRWADTNLQEIESNPSVGILRRIVAEVSDGLREAERRNS